MDKFCICKERRPATRKLIDENGEFFFCCEREECKQRIEDELTKLKSINWNICGHDTTTRKFNIPIGECREVQRTSSKLTLLICTISLIMILLFIFLKVLNC
jgi:hypothetical protein